MHVISPLFNFNPSCFNRLFSKSQIYGNCDRFDGSNLSGIFKVLYSKKTNIYITDEVTQLKYPIVGLEFSQAAENYMKVTSFRSGRSNFVPMAVLENPTKTSRIHSNQKNSNYQSQVSSSTFDSPPSSKKQKLVGQNYWHSPEAAILFCPPKSDISSEFALRRRVATLKNTQNHNQWRLVCQGHDIDNICSDYDKIALRQKSLFLLKAYQIALEKMLTTSWLGCCKEAVATLNTIGISIAKTGQTVTIYNRVFREREVFLHPNHTWNWGKEEDKEKDAGWVSGKGNCFFYK